MTSTISSAATKAKLYYNPGCPFAHRARLAVYEKGAQDEVEFVNISLQDMPEWYITDVNPAATVPCLVKANGEKVFESEYISLYFDEAYGVRGALQPGTAAEKYRARTFTDAAMGVMWGAYPLVTTPAETEEQKAKVADLKANVRTAVGELERKFAAASPDGPYYFGTTFSYVDIAVLPFFLRFNVMLKAYHEFELLEGAPRLQRWLREALNRPSFTATAVPNDRYIASYVSKHPNYKAKHQLKLFLDTGAFGKTLRTAIVLKGLVERVEVVVVEGNSKGPHGELPAFEAEEGLTLAGSLPILYYLDENFRGGEESNETLFPTEPQAAHDTRFLTNVLRGDLGEQIFSFVGDDVTDKEKDQRKTALITGLKELNQSVEKRNAGPFFLGEKASFADVANVALLEAATAAVSKAEPSIDFADTFPRLANWIEAAKKLDAFKL